MGHGIEPDHAMGIGIASSPSPDQVPIHLFNPRSGQIRYFGWADSWPNPIFRMA